MQTLSATGPLISAGPKPMSGKYDPGQRSGRVAIGPAFRPGRFAQAAVPVLNSGPANCAGGVSLVLLSAGKSHAEPLRLTLV